MFEQAKRLAAGLAIVSSAPLSAQAITQEQAAQAVIETERLIREKYVFPEMRDRIAAKLQQGRASGRYSVTRAEELGARVTEDLLAVSKDKHLSLRWNPDWYRSATAAPGSSRTPDRTAFEARMARLTNHGIEEVRSLDGNVLYLRLSRFFWLPDISGRRIDAAMELLKDADAVILDLSANGGGSASGVNYLLSHFLPADEEKLLMTFLDGTGSSQSTVVSYLPSGRIKAPLFVITGENSASAAEEFAYHVKHFKLGTLVGGRTAGAANNNALFPVAPGFQASISFGRPVHPVTKTNWEGAGIEPDVPAPPEKALLAAHVKALEAIATRTPEAERSGAQWRLDRYRSMLNPYPAGAADQLSYVGVYGERRVWIEGGTLMWQRKDRPRMKLQPFAKDVFAMDGDPALRVRFLRGPKGRAEAVEMLFDNGTINRIERTR